MRTTGTIWPASEGSLADSSTQALAPAPDVGLLRHSKWDAGLVGLALLHGVVLLSAPPFWVIALGLWWNANTISHNFVHLPFFRSRSLNRCFSVYLSLLLGLPQSLWRERHLAHHRNRSVEWRALKSNWTITEGVLVVALWIVLLGISPEFFLSAYLPGWLLGLVLCQMQGHFEHVHGTASHYGWLYNWLFFNDGFHVEHHAKPARHWTQLPRTRLAGDSTNQSRWPAVLRWLDELSLDGLERVVLRSRWLQSFVLRCHERAFRRLLSQEREPRRVTVVGGGLFPRTALVLRRVLPDAALRIVDARADHLALAKPLLDPAIELQCGFFKPHGDSTDAAETDLVVIPLAFVGDRSAIYRHPLARRVLVHDWIWRKRGDSVVISIWLLKRLNLVRA